MRTVERTCRTDSRSGQLKTQEGGEQVASIVSDPTCPLLFGGGSGRCSNATLC
jgi:hypothetical protein